MTTTQEGWIEMPGEDRSQQRQPQGSSEGAPVRRPTLGPWRLRNKGRSKPARVCSLTSKSIGTRSLYACCLPRVTSGFVLRSCEHPSFLQNAMGPSAHSLVYEFLYVSLAGIDQRALIGSVYDLFRFFM